MIKVTAKVVDPGRQPIAFLASVNLPGRNFSTLTSTVCVLALSGSSLFMNNLHTLKLTLLRILFFES